MSLEIRRNQNEKLNKIFIWFKNLCIKSLNVTKRQNMSNKITMIDLKSYSIKYESSLLSSQWTQPPVKQMVPEANSGSNTNKIIF